MKHRVRALAAIGQGPLSAISALQGVTQLAPVSAGPHGNRLRLYARSTSRTGRICVAALNDRRKGRRDRSCFPGRRAAVKNDQIRYVCLCRGGPESLPQTVGRAAIRVGQTVDISLCYWQKQIRRSQGHEEVRYVVKRMPPWVARRGGLN